MSLLLRNAIANEDCLVGFLDQRFADIVGTNLMMKFILDPSSICRTT